MTREPIAVLGVGGIGGMIAARTGALCVGTERTVEAIGASGLTLVDGDRTLVVHPDAVTHLDRPVTLLVVAVKAYDLDAALDRVEASTLDGAVVLPLINGLDHVDVIRARIRACVDSTQALPVVVAGSIGNVEAFAPEPGLVVQRTPGATVTAASRELDRTALDGALEPLRVDGVEVVIGDDERAVLWDKAARLGVLAAANVASGRTIGELRDDEPWRGRLAAALDESCRVAVRDGVQLDPAAQWRIIEAMPHDLTTSAARDASAGRPTELDAITGSVVRAAARLAVATPVLDELLAEAHARAHA